MSFLMIPGPFWGVFCLQRTQNGHKNVVCPPLRSWRREIVTLPDGQKSHPPRADYSQNTSEPSSRRVDSADDSLFALKDLRAGNRSGCAAFT